jgi:hypothetical protein
VDTLAQLVAEGIAAMQQNQTPEPIYMIRVIGTRFSFLLGEFPKDLLEDVEKGMERTGQPTTIKQYPLFPLGFNFAVHEERTEIIKCLDMIKYKLLEQEKANETLDTR